jgi:hypothetical protein
MCLVFETDIIYISRHSAMTVLCSIRSIFFIQRVWLLQTLETGDSCKDLFKKLDILQFYSQYMFSLLILVIVNTSLFKTNSELYINTRNKNNFHLSQPRLSTYTNDVYYMGIKAFNHLPSYIKELSDDKI